ncbi:uncharacterized protein L969DRAFT_96929 [Mixia osmundae IAM 14324]|uniref:Probable 26S proteasome regulatory subunit p27 n=1 Tax=Mixia osmundae (strain CBS 9802 / IAM 14324 / JCM 22182 / KY 12970) TaxID=764103 RepID=G7E2I2_MIXOS|nr:uncharacterized protein L969DRAFT_96929 [Mixia osmundae IAM 14324]KEI36914.1 hypothetical protein L969DRAFT_96929 [Mixia osmundae IAM 14324]GAA97042.1 hypothetical protein E5Q_03717 [Mixia osmundae IAM 14324]
MSSSANQRQEALRLAERRSNLEAELEVHLELLQSHGVTLNSALVDREGFPRADVDISAILEARARIRVIRNDLKTIEGNLARLLQDVFQTSGDDAQVYLNGSASTPDPFALVKSVDAGSPAASAGLHEGDKIIRFAATGPHPVPAESLQAVGALVQKSLDKPLRVQLLRRHATDDRDVMKLLQLTPTRWSGRGTLGCFLVPI